jgi:DNA adenine methylase
MTQKTLFPDFESGHIVNVAQVPHRSPFRYPGGKTWFVPRLRQWLASMDEKPRELIEPFAGGASIGLTAAFEHLVSSVTFVEYDFQIAAVWETIINDEGGAEWLANRIVDFTLTPESAQEILTQENISREEEAFRTIIKNRVNHGGIMAPGSGVLKHGEAGKGIQSRWYPETLKKRILEIGKIRHRLKFIHDDGLTIMRENSDRTDVIYFIDPPYTAAGKKAGRRLYTFNELDHEELFRLTDAMQGRFLMTYDNAEGVKALADQHNFDRHLIPMKNNHHAKMTELLISRNLDWLCEAEKYVAIVA